MARKPGQGRKRWQPNNPVQARALVEALAGFGYTHDAIGSMMDPPCGRTVLLENYRDVIDQAVVTFKARVEGTLARMALGLPEVRVGKKLIQKEVPPDKTMLIFLLKSRFGYRDSQRHEITGLENLNLENMTDAQLDQLATRLSKRPAPLDSGGAEEAGGAPVPKVH
jgi:hypothetical protein